MIGYLVLPPGHGKSYHHCSIPGLVEADTIYGCRDDEELKRLRALARETSDWDKYDTAWVSRIQSRLITNNWVIMVPSKEVGVKLGGTLLGVGQLLDNQWNKNLHFRGKSAEDYGYARQEGPDVTTFVTNNELHDWIVEKSSSWLSSYPTSLNEAIRIHIY